MMINGYASLGALRLETKRATEVRLMHLPPPKGPVPDASFTDDVHAIVTTVWAETSARLTMLRAELEADASLTEEVRENRYAEALTKSSQIEEVGRRVRTKHPGAPIAAIAAVICASPQYEAWTQECVVRIRAAGRLLTDAQYIDLSSGRKLQVGDHARYVGPTRIEFTNDRHVTRQHGQVGTITSATKSTDGLLKVTFLPYVGPGLRDAAFGNGLDIELVSLVVSDAHNAGYFDLERIIA